MKIDLQGAVSVRDLVCIPFDSKYVECPPGHNLRADLGDGIWLIHNIEGPFQYSKIWQAGFGYIVQPVPLQTCFLPLLEQWMGQNGVEPTEDFPI